MMKGMLLHADGLPFDVAHRANWNTAGVIESVLRCHSVVQVPLPPTASTKMALFLPNDAYLIEAQVNDDINGLLNDVREGRVFRGDALFVGVNPKTGRRLDLGLSQIFQLGRRLLEAKQLV